ncbi:MAG: hypothetical protein J6Y00_00805 [Paludibacteraceae bacterium]|nr:hypothetical protein [Paludibacteraceae bacterium]
MNKLFCQLSVLLMVVFFSSCSTHKTIAYSKSEPVCIASELDGSYTLRLEGRGRNAADAYEEAGKQAVYAVLFTDVSWPDSPNKRIDPVFYMKQRGYEVNKAYFDAFFQKNGEYTKYISMKEKRILTSIYTRTNSQTVCRTTVCVFVSQLRQRLIEDGILK